MNNERNGKWEIGEKGGIKSKKIREYKRIRKVIKEWIGRSEKEKKIRIDIKKKGKRRYLMWACVERLRSSGL